ncbi:MAG: leucyl/phenylalanyl-tRNA--protein transferase [Bacteroidota bacterium]
MPVYALTEDIFFPPPQLANPEGILAVGGDLRPERLLLAYHMGIFPWYSEYEPIVWWSPDPRCVLETAQLKVSKSMRQILRRNQFQVSFDQAFGTVIQECRKIKRKGQHGTWITDEMEEAYCSLHDMGFAHSVEVWENEQLVGGLYGVSVGRCFFGESMFSRVSNASKTGFITLVKHLQKAGFNWIDCQIYNDHLGSLGASEISREAFLRRLADDIKQDTLQGNWETLLKAETQGSGLGE